MASPERRWAMSIREWIQREIKEFGDDIYNDDKSWVYYINKGYKERGIDDG